MTSKWVVCADCGKRFLIEIDEQGNFNPEHCPACNMIIQGVSSTPTSDDDSAWGGR